MSPFRSAVQNIQFNSNAMDALTKIETLPCAQIKSPIGEFISIYRLQIGLTFSKIPVKINTPVSVRLNGNDIPYFVMSKNENILNSTQYFDFLSLNVKEIKDINFLKINGASIQHISKVELFINGVSKPVFYKIFDRNEVLDNSFSDIFISGNELRQSFNWKTVITSNKIYLPVKSIPASMLTNMARSVLVNYLNYLPDNSDYSTNNKFPVIELEYINSQMIRFHCNIPYEFNFDVSFKCDKGVIKTHVAQYFSPEERNASTSHEQHEIIEIIEELFSDKNSEPGILSSRLSYAINISIDDQMPSQSCSLIQVTEGCEIVLH